MHDLEWEKSKVVLLCITCLMLTPAQWGTGQDQMRIVKQRLLEMIPGLSVFLECAAA